MIILVYNTCKSYTAFTYEVLLFENRVWGGFKDDKQSFQNNKRNKQHELSTVPWKKYIKEEEEGDDDNDNDVPVDTFIFCRRGSSSSESTVS